MDRTQTAQVQPKSNLLAGCTVPPLPVFDLSKVMGRVATEHPDWSPERLAEAEAGYRSFLGHVKATPGERHVPSKDVDEVWHAHILFTRQYFGDCQQYLGGYLHHNPFDKKSPGSDLCSGGYCDDVNPAAHAAGCQGGDCGADSCTSCGAGTIQKIVQ